MREPAWGTTYGAVIGSLDGVACCRPLSASEHPVPADQRLGKGPLDELPQLAQVGPGADLRGLHRGMAEQRLCLIGLSARLIRTLDHGYRRGVRQTDCILFRLTLTRLTLGKCQKQYSDPRLRKRL